MYSTQRNEMSKDIDILSRSFYKYHMLTIDRIEEITRQKTATSDPLLQQGAADVIGQ